MFGTQNLQNTLDVKSILKGCLSGIKAQQELLYSTYAPMMFAICLRYAKDYHSAEDVLQEGFIKVFGKLNDYRGDGSFEGWMKRIFINTSIEQNRKSTRNRYQSLQEGDMVKLEPDVIEQLIKDDLIQMIQSLPDGYRNIFNLYVIDGFNHKEIAKLLGISEGTSKSQLARARNTLKKSIIKLHEST